MRRAAELTWTAEHRDADKSGEELGISHPLAGTQAALGRLVFSGFEVAGNVFYGGIEGFGESVVETHSTGPRPIAGCRGGSPGREGRASILCTAIGVEYRTLG
jgi:hypothetical protein